MKELGIKIKLKGPSDYFLAAIRTVAHSMDMYQPGIEDDQQGTGFNLFKQMCLGEIDIPEDIDEPVMRLFHPLIRAAIIERANIVKDPEIRIKIKDFSEYGKDND